MAILRLKRNRLKNIVLGALICVSQILMSPPSGFARTKQPAEPAASGQQSRITGVTVAGSQIEGTFGGVAYRRIWGTVSGIVSPRDTLRGFDQLAHDASTGAPAA